MYIYKTTNKVNGKIYVGQSKYDPEENPDYLGSGYILIKALAKYGRGSFEKEILETCETKQELCEREKHWIEKLGSQIRGKGYNISSGGEFGDTWTHNPRKEELRQKFRELNGGENNPNYGNKWTDEQKEHLSKTNKKLKPYIDPQTGLNRSKLPEVRKKISESKLGLKNPNGVLWKLISADGEEYFIEGGIKRKIKEFGVDYQQFKWYDPSDNCIRYSKDGWTLIKIGKHNGKD